MLPLIPLLLFLLDAFSSADARFIQSYNVAVNMNTKGNDGIVPGKDVVGDNNLGRSGHEIGKKKKVPSPHKSYEHYTAIKKDRAMAFHPLGHSPGIGHDDPPGRV